MRILYLKLLNFANIYTATGRKEIEINLKKSKNKITLLIGPNGSGKTSVLSELHPFAYAGNMDARNNISLIMKNENGYKEIHIEDDSHIYIIKHHYISKKDSVSLKSFISKDGVELNPNGNVTSFKDIVSNELNVDPSYMVLLRLGSNVTNFIDLNRTERKNYISTKLNDIAVYNECLKNVSIHDRNIKSRIRVLTDKLNELHIADISEYESNLSYDEKSLSDMKESRDLYQSKKGELNGKISGMILPFNSVNELLDNIETYKVTLSSLMSQRDNLEKSIQNSYPVVIIGDIEENLEYFQNMKSEAEKTLISLKTSKDIYQSEYDKLSIQKNKIVSDSHKYNNDESINRLKERRDILIKELDTLKEFSETPKYNKIIMEQYISILKSLDFHLNKIFEYPTEVIRDIVNITGSKKRPDKVLDEREKDISKRMDNISLSEAIKKTNIMALYQPTECKVYDCPLLAIYEASKTKSNMERLEDLEYKREIIHMERNILSHIDGIKLILNTNKMILELVNIVDTSVEKIINCILTENVITDKDKINESLEYINKNDRYVTLRNDIETIDREIELYSGENKTNIEKEIKNIDNSINELSIILSGINRDMLKVTDELDSLESIISGSIYKMKELNSIKEDIINIETSKKMYESKFDIVKDLYEEISESSRMVSSLDNSISSLESKIFNDKRKLLTAKEIIIELHEVQEEYEKVSYIRKSLTPKDGIPLIYIKLFFKNIEKDVNDLLDIVYKDSLYIDKFDIRGDEFSIPYVKNGLLIDDVQYASQGETSFISIALSFALSSKAMTRYNIPLLDEIDSTLDTTNRSLFLDIMEKYIEKNDIEQLFMITHNNMFDSYPVDVIKLGDTYTELLNQNIVYSL